MEKLFVKDDEVNWIELGKGVRRKVMAHNEALMVVKVRFEAGAVGELHAHPHVQTSYVSAGKFRYTIESEIHILQQGDTCIIPAGAQHGCECLEAGELIDAFTPFREDFL
ncbi:cupin domain-containing protein [Sphingobacterium sp. LRF_L2]|uniref:cupin domain-containing protein n=1 Tax=Sphingobacterium sp. LRF_L2 TaxID=3369421 RepID=UPI003F60F58C